MTIAPHREPEAPARPEVLIKEARRRGRRHLAIVVGAVLLIAATVAGAVGWLGARSPARPVRVPTAPPPLAAGTTATVQRLGRGSTIWVVDMLSGSHGFAIAAQAGRDRPAYLVSTASGGRSWTVRSRLPYALTDEFSSVPSLSFVNGRVGYTQSGYGSSGANRDVYVTADGGLTWRPLSFSGVTPTAAGDNLTQGSVNESYQVAGGVLSLVALRCTGSELRQGGSTCPSVLEQFTLGSVRPFATRAIPPVADTAQRGTILSDRLLAAVSARTVIVAEGDLEGWSPVLISRNGGRTWTQWPTPCGSIHVGAVDVALPVQELNVFTANRWLLDCWQDEGMSQGAIVVSASGNQGRTWHLLSEGSEGSGEGGIPDVGTIGDVDRTLWSSNDGRVLWAWDSTEGWLSVSTDGGHHWTEAGVPTTPGGPPTVDLSPVAPRGAILVVSGKAFETIDGVHWHDVRLLPLR